jgi:formamidopyrimidine-DNA glycosylase
VPELPEVEVVRAGLEPVITGAKVASVEVFDERSLRRHDGPSEDFVDRLVGARFEAPRRRGKFMWIPLASPVELVETEPSRVSTGSTRPSALVVHLGMSGQVLLRDQGTDDLRTRIRIDLENGFRLNFVDQRIFGSMAIDALQPADHEESVPATVAHIARDPLDPHFDERIFFARLAKRNTGVKRALLDQGLISGIGNIYADEALWMSRIHYEHPTAILTLPQKKRLLENVRGVFHQALAEGGTSFDEQYKNVNGTSGYFERSLKAYGRQGEPCLRCGRLMVRESFMNRGSHYCPHCQRMPKTTV